MPAVNLAAEGAYCRRTAFRHHPRRCQAVSASMYLAAEGAYCRRTTFRPHPRSCQTVSPSLYLAAGGAYCRRTTFRPHPRSCLRGRILHFGCNSACCANGAASALELYSPAQLQGVDSRLHFQALLSDPASRHCPPSSAPSIASRLCLRVLLQGSASRPCFPDADSKRCLQAVSTSWPSTHCLSAPPPGPAFRQL